MSKAKIIAVCGVLSALATVFLIAGAYLPINYTTSLAAALCVLANAFVAPKNFWSCFASYAASTIIACLITGKYLEVLPFVLLFAPLCVSKYYLDQTKIPKAAGWVINVALFEAGLAAYLCVYRFLFFETWQTVFEQKWYLYVAIAVAQAVFVLYMIALKYVFLWLKQFMTKLLKL